MPKPLAPEPVSEPKAPIFQSSSAELPEDLVASMAGVSWHAGCPVPMTSLRLVRVSHFTGDGVAQGELVLNEDAVDVVVRAFEAAFEKQFEIQSVKPIHHFDGSDDASMTANNTSAFNCRRVKGTQNWSQHSWGRAIDVNPLVNPWVRGDKVDPPQGRAYLDRTAAVPGLLTADSAMTRAFVDAGWGWGGAWGSRKDYQHFSASGK
ncbi:MAG: M15 family peptidase [Rhodobacterales bacterium]|nr:M15 family peptidase [Rhodobacterales bacterium]